MIVKNVETTWAFIQKPDMNGNFRVTFKVSAEQDKELQNTLEAVLKDNGKTLQSAAWVGSRKEEEDGSITYSAKCAQTYKNKNGEEKTRELPVYDRRAIRLRPEEVPNITNGSICNVDVEPYFATYQKKHGAMLSFRGIQLVKYEEFIADGCKFTAIDESEGGENRGFKSDEAEDDDADELF